MPILSLIALWPRVSGALILFVACGVALILNNSHQRSIGAEKVVAKMEQTAHANAKKADDARRSAEQLPPDRLRDKYFRD